jgi:spore coat protein E
VYAHDTETREIITNAVCGKGHKYSQSTYTIRTANKPTTIGGCWVMNHTCEGLLAGDVVEVHGRFDVNVWYSYNGNSETAVAKDTVSYVEQIPVLDLDPNCIQTDLAVSVKVLQQPNCLDATVTGDAEIAVRVEMNHAVEVVGKTKLLVLTVPPVAAKKDVFEDESSFALEESLN